MKPRYRVVLRHGIGQLQARRPNRFLIFPTWQTIATGPPEDLQCAIAGGLHLFNSIFRAPRR